MDDKTIPIINFSPHFDDCSTNTAILTDDTYEESDASPILTTTMLLASRHKIWKKTIQQQNLENFPMQKLCLINIRLKLQSTWKYQM